MKAEAKRLLESHHRSANWQRWGPYLAERQWGTVREDYSANGDCWTYFTHDHSRSRAYRWGEDGLLGICDRECRLCFAPALWNGYDSILKERLFGLTGPEGNHGEDVKECYYYLDSTPTHSYMQALYKYPQREFPYQRLTEENKRRNRHEREWELVDSGIFDDHRYFDILVEYAKQGPDDLLIRITAANRGPESANLHVLPTLWFRNTWSWGCTHEGCEVKPRLSAAGPGEAIARHVSLGEFRFFADLSPAGESPQWLFTENETNSRRLFGDPSGPPFAKDAFHDYVIQGLSSAVNPHMLGTKTAAYYQLVIPSGGNAVIRLRLTSNSASPTLPFDQSFQCVFDQRRNEANEFYADIQPPSLAQNDPELARISRQAYAGLLWNKQFYHYVVKNWLEGDPEQLPPPASRRRGRNHDWPHLFNRDVISMPDKWEYPWYAAWDLAFHMIPMAQVDPEFAKAQLELFLREWYMHPNGQIPAYEFSLSDVNPPVHAWACWRVYKMTGDRGARDRRFLASVFQKLLINFTWWVNRKDFAGNHLFSGGFLGLDNIGVFDRSKPLPGGAVLEQADGTAWMAFYCATMLSMAIELARDDPSFEDIASKFFEHFIHIADAMNSLGGNGLWNEKDGFYYDQMSVNGTSIPLEIRSIVGVIPLFAVEVLQENTIRSLPNFTKRMEWFLKYRPDLAKHIAYCERSQDDNTFLAHRLLAIPSRERLTRALKYVLDENEFLSPFGVRSLSRFHKTHPYRFQADGEVLRVDYIPGESNSGFFGGNSNWRGPIWFPTNYLLVEALERYHHFYGNDFQVECPTGSGRRLNLAQVAREIASRLTTLFTPNGAGERPCHGGDANYARDPHWKSLPLFYEYFDGDSGRGLGASHQTGWTALIAPLINSLGEKPPASPKTRP